MGSKKASVTDNGGISLHMLPPSVLRFRGSEFTVGPETPAAYAFNIMHGLQLDVLPVVDQGMVCGTVKLPNGYPKNKDVLKYFYNLFCKEVSDKAFGRNYPRASLDLTVDDALNLMKDYGLSHLPLVGKGDKHLGMVGSYGSLGLLNLDESFARFEATLLAPKRSPSYSQG